jgi:hypothetical protein
MIDAVPLLVVQNKTSLNNIKYIYVCVYSTVNLLCVCMIYVYIQSLSTIWKTSCI